MRLVNKTKSLLIHNDAEVAESFFRKTRGLMFAKGCEKPLLFKFSKTAKETNAIHSFFVFFPFDAVFLDERRRVVDIRNVKPFTLLVIPKKPARYLIEIKDGEARRKRIEVGDRIDFEG